MKNLSNSTPGAMGSCTDHCETGCTHAHPIQGGAIRRLQWISLIWMTVECAVALTAAVRARSLLLLAFGGDSFVELLSAAVVLAAVVPGGKLTPQRANRWAGALLYVLAGFIVFAALAALMERVEAESSLLGISIAVAALIAMPVLARAKRRLAKATGNRALGADAMQSAACAWLAAATLTGLALNALFGLRRLDAAIALAATPLLILEARRAMRGESCGCC